MRFDASEAVTGVAGNFEIRNAATNALVQATLASNAARTRWTLTPTIPAGATVALAAGTTYRVTITGGAAAVRDGSGNPLTGNTGAGSTTYTWTFTTR